MCLCSSYRAVVQLMSPCCQQVLHCACTSAKHMADVTTGWPRSWRPARGQLLPGHRAAPGTSSCMRLALGSLHSSRTTPACKTARAPSDKHGRACPMQRSRSAHAWFLPLHACLLLLYLASSPHCQTHPCGASISASFIWSGYTTTVSVLCCFTGTTISSTTLPGSIRGGACKSMPCCAAPAMHRNPS